MKLEIVRWRDYNKETQVSGWVTTSQLDFRNTYKEIFSCGMLIQETNEYIVLASNRQGDKYDGVQQIFKSNILKRSNVEITLMEEVKKTKHVEKQKAYKSLDVELLKSRYNEGVNYSDIQKEFNLNYPQLKDIIKGLIQKGELKNRKYYMGQSIFYTTQEDYETQRRDVYRRLSLDIIPEKFEHPKTIENVIKEQDSEIDYNKLYKGPKAGEVDINSFIKDVNNGVTCIEILNKYKLCSYTMTRIKRYLIKKGWLGEDKVRKTYKTKHQWLKNYKITKKDLTEAITVFSTYKDAADYLGISQSTLRRMAKVHKLVIPKGKTKIQNILDNIGVVKFLNDYFNLSNQEMAEKYNVSASTLSNIIKELRDEGKLTKTKRIVRNEEKVVSNPIQSTTKKVYINPSQKYFTSRIN